MGEQTMPEPRMVTMEWTDGLPFKRYEAEELTLPDGNKNQYPCWPLIDEFFERAKACANALRDIPDPAEYVKNVERLVEASSAMDTLLSLNCVCDPRDNYTCASCKWRTALTALATTNKHD